MVKQFYAPQEGQVKFIGIPQGDPRIPNFPSILIEEEILILTMPIQSKEPDQIKKEALKLIDRAVKDQMGIASRMRNPENQGMDRFCFSIWNETHQSIAKTRGLILRVTGRKFPTYRNARDFIRNAIAREKRRRERGEERIGEIVEIPCLGIRGMELIARKNSEPRRCGK